MPFWTISAHTMTDPPTYHIVSRSQLACQYNRQNWDQSTQENRRPIIDVPPDVIFQTFPNKATRLFQNLIKKRSLYKTISCIFCISKLGIFAKKSPTRLHLNMAILPSPRCFDSSGSSIPHCLLTLPMVWYRLHIQETTFWDTFSNGAIMMSSGPTF